MHSLISLELIEKNMDKLAPLMLFTAISETEQVAHQVMWESLLVFIQSKNNINLLIVW